MQENDFKTLLENVISALDYYYCNPGNCTQAGQALKEIQITNHIKSILEHINKRHLRNFQYELVMIDYEDDEQ